ncbi:APC family permease [Geodermatophilus sp. CPCC 206100]|uniref:APC family permease n=1 Tax=Geodermatophilus sp. CPCC 206100 TaxID=3020054 RepID=UPI003B006B3E
MTARPDHVAPAPSAGDGHLKPGVLGTGSIVFMVVAAAAPLTILAGIAPLAILIGGIGAPVAYLFGGLTLAVFAVAFTRMTAHVGSAGAFYAYIAKGLGRAWGLAAAILALMSYNAIQIGVYGLLAVQTQATLSDLFGVTVPWPVIALVAIALVFLVGWAGIDVGAKVLGVLLVLETGILLLLAFAVVFQGGASGLDGASFTPDAVFSSGMGAALGFAFAAFIGFESTAIYRREARDPARTIPRATYIAIVGMAVTYCFIVWAVVQAFGSDRAQAAAGEDPVGMFFTAIATYVGPWAATLMSVLIVTSVYAAQLAFHNAINRYAFALAQDGVLPARLTATHRRFRSPYVAGIVQTILAAVVVLAFAVAGADPYARLLLWVNAPGAIGIFLLMFLTAVATVVYFARRNPAASRPSTIAAGIGSSVLLGVALYVAVDNIELNTAASTGVNAVLIGIVPLTLLIGLGLAVWLRRSRPATYARIGEGEDTDEQAAADATPAAAR